MADIDEFTELSEIDELRRALSKRNAELAREKAKTGLLVQAAHEGARDAALILGNPPAVPTVKRDRRKGGEIGLLHVSDWQVGKKTESYSSDVAQRRATQLGEKLARLIEIERADHPVNELHILLGGDMVEGASIFPGQAHEIDSSLFDQAFTAATMIEQLVRLALATVPRVVVWEVEGNHGRLGRKGDLERKDNADLFVYRVTRDRLAPDNRRLVWHERRRWYQIVEAGNYRALLVHGDQIKQFGGNIPAFGIYRKVNGWAAGSIPEPFVDAYLGHFHQPLVIPLANGRGRAYVNASLESDNVFAQEFIAATGTPGQRLHFIDPDRGRITSERILWLD